MRHPERSKHHGAVFAQSNFQKRTINRAFLKGKGQSPLRISHGALIAFLENKKKNYEELEKATEAEREPAEFIFEYVLDVAILSDVKQLEILTEN